jgi:hypothetical protein
MHILLDKHYTITQDGDGNVIVTRPSILGKVATHTIQSRYDAFEIGRWLYNRTRRRAPLVQTAFPEMEVEDREFLISGVTPDIWAEVFKREEEDAAEDHRNEGDSK